MQLVPRRETGDLDGRAKSGLIAASCWPKTGPTINA